MARKKSGKAYSRSAMGKQEDEEERRRKDVPMFSLEGIRVHWKTLGAYTGAIILALFVAGIVVGSVTNAGNFDVTLSTDFVQAKAGSTFTFDASVHNTAQLSPYAYETHLIGLPPGWTVVQGEDVFGLPAGETHTVHVVVLAGGSTPPNHDYPVELKVIAKTPDGARELISKSGFLTVKLLGTEVEVQLLSRGSSVAFEGGASEDMVSFTGCGTSGVTSGLAFPGGATPTSAGVSFRLTGPDVNATGTIEVDLGADGSFELNRTLNAVGGRFDLPVDKLAEWADAHPQAGGNATLPLALRACVNGTAPWNVTLDAPLVSYLAPLAANGSYAVSFDNVDQPTGTAIVSIRVTNRETRDIVATVALPDLPGGWTTSLPAGGSPLTLEANGGHRTTEFTVNVAKNASVGINAAALRACLQGNPNDCTTTDLPLSVGETHYFEVKTYLEPSQIRNTYVTRSADVLLFARNLGNQPTTFVPSVDLNVPDVATSFWYGDHLMESGENITLQVTESRFLVMRVQVSPTAPQSVAQVHPMFEGSQNGQVQQLFINVQISPFPAPESEGPIAVGDNVTVEYTVSTADGALLYRTNLLTVTSLVDAGSRPTHANYTKQASTAYSPYQFTLRNQSAYSGTVHEGFEASLLGAYRQETLVFWLSPDQTLLPPDSPVRADDLVVEVHIVGLERA